MNNAPAFDIDIKSFWSNPYPTLARLQREAPIAYVPQLDAVLLTRMEDIVSCEKNIEVFSSEQPMGLMNRLMGHNMMRKDGDAHLRERRVAMPSLSPRVVKQVWTRYFQQHADRLLDELVTRSRAEFVSELAMPLSAEALKTITGLHDVEAAQFDQWSQAMIDGIANYSGNIDIEERCHVATAAIDAAIDRRIAELRTSPDQSLLSVLLHSELPMDSVRANIKLVISGGQNEPRDAIAGTVWALLNHPEQHAKVRAGAVSWLQVFNEYVRWISPIGMSPRRVAIPWQVHGIQFDPGDKVFFMFSAANRDSGYFQQPDLFDVSRDTRAHIAFGAGPHFCAGAAASRALIVEVALPTIFARLPKLQLDPGDKAEFGGWAFRGLLKLPVCW